MKRGKKNTGSALIFVLVFMVLGVIIGTATLVYVQTDFNTSVANIRYEQSYYDAESAAQMATQLALLRIGNITAGNSILGFSDSCTITVDPREFDDADTLGYKATYLNNGMLDVIAFAEDTSEVALRTLAGNPSDPTGAVPLRQLVAEGLRETAADTIRGNLEDIAGDVEESLSDDLGITVDVAIAFSDDDLVWEVFCTNASVNDATGVVLYDYNISYTFGVDTPIVFDTTVNNRTIRATLIVRTGGVSFVDDGSGMGTTVPVSGFSSNARIRVSEIENAGTIIESIEGLPTNLIPVAENSLNGRNDVGTTIITDTHFNGEVDTSTAYQRLTAIIETIYKDVMATKGACTLGTLSSYTGSGHTQVTADTTSGSGQRVVIDTGTGSTIRLMGTWANLEEIVVLGSGTLIFGGTQESDAFVAERLLRVDAPGVNVFFQDCIISNMRHACMDTVTFGGGVFGAYIYHTDRTAPFCEMLVGCGSDLSSVLGATSPPTGTKVTIGNRTEYLLDTVIFSAGPVSSSITGGSAAIACNAIFFAAGNSRMPIATKTISVSIDAPQFYVWGNLIISVNESTHGDNTLRGVYACSGSITITGNIGNRIAAYIIGNIGSFSPPGTTQLIPIDESFMAALPDVFAERVLIYMRSAMLQQNYLQWHRVIAVRSEGDDMVSIGRVTIVNAGELLDISIDRAGSNFSGIREIR